MILGWGGGGNPCFNLPFNDWDLEDLESFFCFASLQEVDS